MISADKKPVVIADRVVGRLRQLAAIGGREDGIYCMALSQEENDAHQLVRGYMEEAGLTVRVDAAGNLIGRREGTDPDAPVVMTGSHIDTVYGGGAYDGRLGVIAGIEALQCINEQGIKTKHPIEVCAYRDEEGTRFLGGYSGAMHMTGQPASTTLAHKDRDGISVREALKGIGIDPERVKDAALPPGYAKAHLEVHIEQGAVLESMDLAVGVVTGICCQIRGEFIVRGQAAHAGTTPIPLRKDALCAASEIILAIEEETRSSEGCVATVGCITVEPGGVNIVPGAAKFSIDMRHLDPAVRDELFDRVCERAEEICQRRGCQWEVNLSVRQMDPRPCDESIMEVFSTACQELGYPVHKMPSGAGHDSTAFIPFCPSGMLFVRSKDGLSHNGAEYSSPEDCAAGAAVLYNAILSLAEAE